MIEEVNEKHIKWTSTSLNDAYCVFYKDIKTALDQHEGDNRDTISKTLLDAIKRSKEKNDIIVKDIYPTFIHLSTYVNMHLKNCAQKSQKKKKKKKKKLFLPLLRKNITYYFPY